MQDYLDEITAFLRALGMPPADALAFTARSDVAGMYDAGLPAEEAATLIYCGQA